MPIQHIVGIYLFIQSITMYFLKDIMKGIDNHSEQIKVRFTLRLCFLFLVFTISTASNIYLISIYAFTILLGFIAINIATPFVIKHTKSVYLPAKIFLFGAFTCASTINIIIGNPEGLGIGLWYLVIILSASFILGSRWSLFYTILAFGMIVFLNITTHLEIELFGRNDLKGLPKLLLTPLRIGLPLAFLYVIAKDFITGKEEAESQATNLLVHQKELTAKIAEKESQYRLLIEEADDMIYEIDKDGYFKYINPAVTKTLGYSEEVFATRRVGAFLEREEKVKYLRYYTDQMKNQIPYTYYRFKITTKAGDSIWIGQKTKMFFDESGTMIKTFCVGRNITEQQETTLALEKAKNEAIKHNKMKDNFMSVISHELRTPLNAVIGLGHNILENQPRIDQKEDIEMLLFSANNLLTVVNDILYFSLIETGKAQIRESVFDLNTALAKIVQATSKQLSNKNLSIQYHADRAIPIQLFGGIDRLIQVVYNLVRNAIKFTEEGRIVLTTQLLEETMNEVSIYFEVKDTGIGISSTKINTIFESFTQIDTSLNRTYGGTGLGLTIVKNILQQMNGVIQVKSDIGKGSTFFFTLSFKKVKVTAKKETAVAPSAISMTSLAGTRVLLVEDNKMNQLVAKKFLAKWKTIVEVADNGKIAVEKFLAKEYDLILMDLEMPIMDGFESTRAIRKLVRGKDIPIIAVTASSVSDLLDKLQQDEFTDLVRKPFEPNQLYDKMVEHHQKVAFECVKN